MHAHVVRYMYVCRYMHVCRYACMNVLVHVEPRGQWDPLFCLRQCIGWFCVKLTQARDIREEEASFE